MDKPIFNEEDLKNFFGGKPKNLEEKPRPQPINVTFTPDQKIYETTMEYGREDSSIFKIVGRFIAIFVLIFVIVFSVINAPALIKKMKYFWEIDYRNQSWEGNVVVTPPIPGSNRLVIPKIRVNAPISWNVEETDFTKKLEDGVVHYKGTALPGQTGNVFIFGHSSYFLFAPGSYKDVFALLNELNAGDKIYIQYDGAQFTYEVFNQIVVSPDDINVLDQSNEKILSLMTCVPVGTNLQRLVVQAREIGSQ